MLSDFYSQHVSHPNIVSFVHSFTTTTYYCLLLEHIDGPELLDFINSAEKYGQLDERSLRQIWGELCKAVGWMHSVALVHRDIKLESRLFVSPTFGAVTDVFFRYLIDQGFKRGRYMVHGAVSETH
jgi:serine/threonine protein kinase